MSENQWYTAYDCGDKWKPGSEIKLKHKIVFHSRNATEEMTELTKLPLETLEQNLDQSIAREMAIYEQARMFLNDWEQAAAQTLLLKKAIEYASAKEVEHTNNQWTKDVLCLAVRETISNMVYKMSVRIWTDTKYDQTLNKSVPFAWFVTWDVCLNCSDYTQIAGQYSKRFTDQESAMKYIAGRKKAYADLFLELCPAVPAEYADCFKKNGILLPGYHIEN